MESMGYVKKAEFEKALNTLIGILKGIKADGKVVDQEISELQNWCLLQHPHRSKYPFKEILPIIELSLEDGVLTSDEIEDIKFMCKIYIKINPYYNVVSSDIQELQGVLHGILSDGRITEEELHFLKVWLNNNDHLETVYPYDEIYSSIYNVMKDGKIDEQEELFLKALFSDFIDTTSSININKHEMEQLRKEMNISGICAFGPNIEVEGKVFCFTGESSRSVRSDIEKILLARGGLFGKNVTKDTDYLIVGDEGNPCWVFSCYGRKIEKAIELRKQGNRVVIAHEIDFWDTIG
jgi:hypothetical protein